MTSSLATIPYCGPAPEPQALVAAWNFDPIAIALCGALALAHMRARPNAGPASPLVLGIGVLLVLFVSPLCALTAALFSARVAHHVLLVAVAAPLLALAFPEGSECKGMMRRLPLAWLVGLHAAILWFWHAPQAYAAGVVGAPPYWIMQASLLASAFLLWRRVLSPRTGTGAALLALLATVVQMGMLGALLTFAQAPLYAPHLTTTIPYGLTPLADQQLAGLIMWVPAAMPYLAAALLLLAGRFGRQAGTVSR